VIIKGLNVLLMFQGECCSLITLREPCQNECSVSWDPLATNQNTLACWVVMVTLATTSQHLGNHPKQTVCACVDFGRQKQTLIVGMQ